jgi:hypothetical protein
VARDKQKPLHDLYQEAKEHNERLRELTSKFQDSLAERHRLDAREQQLLDSLEAASDEEDKAALLFEARELHERREELDEETTKFAQEAEELRAEDELLFRRLDEGLENVRTAALETEKMLFEIGKLVATLAIGAIVAMAAVTPALLPELKSLEGLWPAFGWLLTSIVASVMMCMYSLSNVSRLLAQLERTRRSRLPE